MIAKGNFHSGGVKLAAYLVKAEAGERGELIDMRGFGPVSDLRDGFRAEQIRAHDATKAAQPFFHVHFRGAHGEGLKLSRADWIEIANRCDKALGRDMADQPRAASLHIDRRTGDMHMHLGYSLVRESRAEADQFYVVKLGLYKNKLKGLAREIERDYGLKIVSNERRPGDLARAADRNEVEESRRLGTDVRAIRSGILDCFEKSDSGRALKAALDERGLQLANGDRRDCFVVIDAAGGQHALNKKLTGLTLAETRARLADLDRSQLPGVEQAKEMQAERQAARAAQEREKHGRAADAPAQANAASHGPQNGRDVAAKPLPGLGRTAGEIRLAWTLTATAAQFAEDIERRGLILVHVSREDAEESHRAHAFAKAINRQSRELREGFAVVDGRGTVTRIDQRTTGDQWEEIQKRLGGIDRDGLLSVAAAREAMREANRAAWAEQKERERPASGIETTIAGALKATMTGHDFAEALDQAGLTVACATAADQQALAALRHDDELAAASGIEATGRRFAHLEQGDLAAVTKSGDVFRLNPHKIDFEDIGQRLADVQPRMASVTEARAHNQIMREATAELWAEVRAENTARRVAGAEARAADHDIRSAAASVQHAKQETIEVAEQAVDRGARIFGGFLRGLAQLGEKLIDFFGDLIAPAPPPTRDQAEREHRAAEEQAPARAAAAQEAADRAAQDDESDRRRRSARQLEESQLARILGNTSPSEAQRGVDAERTRAKAGRVTASPSGTRRGEARTGTTAGRLRAAMRAIAARGGPPRPHDRGWRWRGVRCPESRNTL
jgi:hypothetical protein